MSGSAPLVLLLRDGPDDMPMARAVMRLAGWTLADGPADRLTDHGADPHRPPSFVEGTLRDSDEAEALVRAVAVGYGAVVASATTCTVWSRFVRAVDELADTRPWESTRLGDLDESQIELLAAIGRGERVPAAARAAAVSERSAHRLLLGARSRLGARSNTHAASILMGEIARLA